MNGKWYSPPTVVFSHLNNGDISYVLDSSIKKGTLASNPRANVLKIRYTDPSYHVSFRDIKYKDVSIVGKKVAKNSTIQLDADVNDTLTVFVFDEGGSNLLYYQALTRNEFSLSGIPVGKYKIAVASEEFNDTTGRPAKTSGISSMKSIEIVEPHKLTNSRRQVRQGEIMNIQRM